MYGFIDKCAGIRQDAKMEIRLDLFQVLTMPRGRPDAWKAVISVVSGCGYDY